MTQRTDILREFANALRTLAAAPASNRAELNEWYAAAERLKNWISVHAELSDVVPHFVWHYLDDADIRLKDPVYGVDQTRQVMDLVHALERGETPEGQD